MNRNTPSRDAVDVGLAWFKSSYSSGAETDSCVEVATEARTVHVRDSKVAEGPGLAFTSAAWAGFVSGGPNGHLEAGSGAVPARPVGRPAPDTAQKLMLPIIPAMLVVSSLIVGAIVDDAR